MLRSADTIYGVLLALLAMGGLATRGAPWFIVLAFVAALCAFYLAAYGQNRAGCSIGTIAIGVVMGIGSIVALVRYSQDPWLYWVTLVVSCASVMVGLAGAWRRTGSPEPPHLFHAPRRMHP